MKPHTRITQTSENYCNSSLNIANRTRYGKKFIWNGTDLQAVRLTTIQQGRISTHYDLDLSWKLSLWGRFFKNLKLFLKATAWHETQKEFVNNFVIHAQAVDEECLLSVPFVSVPTESELAQHKGWICQKFPSTI